MTLIGGVLHFCRDAVGVFYRPSRVGPMTLIGRVLPFCRYAIGVFTVPSRVGPQLVMASKELFHCE